MYSSLKNVQILVSLLKSHAVKNVVISAGTRHTPLVVSLENDVYFKTYSVVDERSASFFALGLIEKLGEPVAICCTSGTAAANYFSAVNEAYYQQLPLLILTADRNPYYLFQQEEQMIPQKHLYSDVCKKHVDLPHVRDEKDFWYCSRVCNEALLELRHGTLGPVHINFIVENDYPINQGIVKFEEEKLPDVKAIKRITLEDSKEEWDSFANHLKGKQLLVIYGQHGCHTTKELEAIKRFEKQYNCLISTDLLSNLKTDYSLNTFALCRALNSKQIKDLLPDIVITMNGNSVSEIKNRLGSYSNSFEHWYVSSDGEVSDVFKNLSNVVECSPFKFFEILGTSDNSEANSHDYYMAWKKAFDTIGDSGNLNHVSLAFSAMYVAQQYINRIPSKSLLHIANSNSIRLANYFTPNKDVEVYCNRGTNGIDGSMSAFVGQAQLTDGLCFLLIGDLSFFYDMNALWNRYVKPNMRIVVCNNSGGAIFHSYPNTTNVPSLDRHIAAEHHNSVKAWVEDRGFTYVSAKTKTEVDQALDLLTSPECAEPWFLKYLRIKKKMLRLSALF